MANPMQPEIDYMRWLSSVRGLARFSEQMELQMSEGRGRGAPALTLGATFGRKLGRDEYEEGAYSIPMPGANQSGLVVMETLDEDGHVIRSQKIATKGRGLAIDKASVVAAVGKIDKPKRARKASPPAAEIEAMPPAVAMEKPTEVPAMAADHAPVAPVALSTLFDRIAAMECAIAEARAGEEKRAADRVADRARRMRIVRRYLAIRKERDLDRRALEAGKANCDKLQGERDAALDRLAAADKRADDAEFRASDIANQLATMTARAESAEAIAAPMIDKAQARIVALEAQLAKLRPPTPINMHGLMYGKRPPTVSMGIAA